MKTFLMSIPESLRINNEKLDATALLCGKSWVVFNDEGKAQEMIFQKGGRLIMSVDGDVSNYQWEYLKENRNILLTTDRNITTMLQPSFQDENILALKVSGLERYMFLIDKKRLNSFVAKTLSELQAYFDEKNKAIAAKYAEEDIDKSTERDEVEELTQLIRKELEEDETFQCELNKQGSPEKKKIWNYALFGLAFIVASWKIIGLFEFKDRDFIIIMILFLALVCFLTAIVHQTDKIFTKKEKFIKETVDSILKEKMRSKLDCD